MDPDFVLRERRHHVLLATHPYAACPDVRLTDKAVGRQFQESLIIRNGMYCL